MSSYFDGKQLFTQPQVTQYGSHMVMTNVNKPLKRKYINIDTRNRDEYSNISMANCNITLPEKISDVVSMMVCNAEIPMTFFNISSDLGNNYFKISYGAESKMVVVSSGEYNSTGLVNEINSKIQALGANYNNLSIFVSDKTTGFDSSGATLTLSFDVNFDGSHDRYFFKRKLGWLLGFRSNTYTITSSTNIFSENFLDLTGLKYIYLVLDEFSKNTQNSFISPMPYSLVNKNILAKITFNRTTFPFGSILPANNFNGYLLTDNRVYTNKADLKRFNVQLVDEIGYPLNLNGIDFSFCLEITHE